MNKETTLEKISRKSGMKPNECKCNLCKMQCKSPCLGTPEDMLKIIQAGYLNRVGKITFQGVQIIASRYDKEKGSCTFFTNGLCELHDSGLKPTVGKLSHHSYVPDYRSKKSNLPSSLVLDEWKNLTPQQAKMLVEKYPPPQ